MTASGGFAWGGQGIPTTHLSGQLELQAVLGDLLLGILRDEFDIQNTAVFRYRR